MSRTAEMRVVMRSMPGRLTLFGQHGEVDEVYLPSRSAENVERSDSRLPSLDECLYESLRGDRRPAAYAR